MRLYSRRNFKLIKNAVLAVAEALALDNAIMSGFIRLCVIPYVHSARLYNNFQGRIQKIQKEGAEIE